MTAKRKPTWRPTRDPRELDHVYSPDELANMTPSEREWLDGVIKIQASARDADRVAKEARAAAVSISTASVMALAASIHELADALSQPRKRTGTIETPRGLHRVAMTERPA